MTYILAALVTGSLVYCILVIVAARKYLAAAPINPPQTFPPISILKPLHGLDDGLEQNLTSFFEQDYPHFEILLAFRTSDDPAYGLVKQICQRYPDVPSRILLGGEPPWPNAKVWSLDLMMKAAANDLLVMSDSDIRVTPSMLRVIAAEFTDDKLGVTTCPYRAVPGKSFWSTLEALGMNTEFLGGIVVARMLEGMRFAVGPTIAARRSVIEAIGGWDLLRQYLAEDFVLGQFAAEAGHGVALSSYVVEHRIGSESLKTNASHRIRWNRSTRRSRPAGYIGQLFTNPLPLALLLVLWAPGWWPVLCVTALVRAAAGAATASAILKDPLSSRLWLLVPLQDLASFLFWLAGFFGNTIVWRGIPYKLLADGKFELLASGREH